LRLIENLSSGILSLGRHVGTNFISATGATTSRLGGGADIFAEWGSEAGGSANYSWSMVGGYLKLLDGSGRQPIAINSANGRHNLLDVEAGYKYGGTQVVGAQGAAIADATDAASAITQLNAALARLRAHGLIAT
jgi:hypothetical protein